MENSQRSLSREMSIGVSSENIEINCPGTVQKKRDFITPREDDDSSPILYVPPSPNGPRKTKSRAGKILHRDDSLNDSKVLLVTGMRRTESVMQPDLFQYQNHFEFLGLVGATKLSEVFKVKHRHTNEIFAVKRSRKHFRSKLQRERCLREIRAVAQLPAHENIVAQYRAWQEGGHFYIQMDFCEGGSLHHRIHAPNAPPLSDTELWNVALQVARGLEFLHSNNILHLDIKPENLYCNLEHDGTRGPWKIGDFGLAVAKESKDWEEGDGDYVAPELLRSGCEPSYAADIFSLGATLYECATKRKLPRREGSPDAADIELEGRPEAFQVLLSAMLLPKAEERPFASQVVAYTLAALEQHNNNGGDNEVEDGVDIDIDEKKDDTFSFDHHQQHASPPTPLLASINTTTITTNTNITNTTTNTAQRPHLTITIPLSIARLPKWAPSLSPLASSDGALTPGAAAGLMKLTPQTGNNGTTTTNGTDNNNNNNNRNHQSIFRSNNNTNNDIDDDHTIDDDDHTIDDDDDHTIDDNDIDDNTITDNATTTTKTLDQRLAMLPPLRLPLHQYNPNHPPSTQRTAETNSFRIRRRDVVSPGSEIPGSNSEMDSEAYSYSCDTPGSASDLDFPDVVVSPHSARVINNNNGNNGSNGNGMNTINNNNTMNNMTGNQQQQNLSRVKSFHLSWEALTHSPDKQTTARRSNNAVSHPLLPPLPPHTTGGVGGGMNSSRSRGDLNSSRSVTNTNNNNNNNDGVGGGLTVTIPSNVQIVGQKCLPSPFQCDAVQQNNNNGNSNNNNNTTKNNKKGGIAALIPPLSLPPSAPSSKARRKRNLSSRRAYAQALKDSARANGNGNGNGDLASSRSIDLCSSRSMEQFMPQKKGARVNGSFHMADSVDPSFNGCDDQDQGQPASGPSTQRSSRGQRSARLEDIIVAAHGHGKDDGKGVLHHAAAAAAAVHMTNMTLRDIA